MTKIPIVFINYNHSDFLNLSILQARSFNPDCEIILLGDKSNKNLKKICTHLFYDNYANRLNKLEKIYKHFSTNSYVIELFCIKRWFILYEFMKDSELDWVCTVDSDVMLYSSVNNFFCENIYKKDYEAAFCIAKQDFKEFIWAASGHSAYVSLHFLEKFCDYIIDTFENHFDMLQTKINYHQINDIPGGICDMTFLYLYKYNIGNKILNLLEPIKSEVYDNNINSGDNFFKEEFGESEKKKNFSFKNSQPHIVNKKDEEIRFLSLHFQGHAKKYILKYYRGKPNKFVLKLKFRNYSNSFNSKIRNFLKSILPILKK